MNTTSLPRTIRLQRTWPERVLDLFGDAAARLQGVLVRWRERRALDDALDLDEATLRDMGMPLWMQEEARARREHRDLRQAIDRLHDRGGLGRYY